MLHTRHAARVARRLALSVNAAMLLLVGCGDDGLTDAGVLDLTRAQGRWTRSGLSGATYTMRQRRACYCLDSGIPFIVRVSGNRVVSVTDPRTGVAVPAEQLAWFRTVDELFTETRVGMGTKDVLTAVEFDAALGYPRTLSLDPVPGAVDDEIAYLTSDVIPAT
jgi:hypothetical protein